MYNSQLNALICVADYGSFHKAAEQLYTSPTAVMKQINTLEQYPGFPPVIRISQGVRLTETNEPIHKDVKYMIDYSNQAVKQARGLTEANHATLRVGTSMSNSCKLFMGLWYRASAHFP